MSCESVLKRSDGWQARNIAVAVPIAVVNKFIEERRGGARGPGGLLRLLLGLLLLAFVSILGFAFRSDPAFQKQILDSTLRLMPVIGPQISGHIGSLTGSTVALVVGLAGAVSTGTSGDVTSANSFRTGCCARLESLGRRRLRVMADAGGARRVVIALGEPSARHRVEWAAARALPPLGPTCLSRAGRTVGRLVISLEEVSAEQLDQALGQE